MKYGLGIDAGGTYTDVVIIDFGSQAIVAKGKALTTKGDLGIGIGQAIQTLPTAFLQAVDLVSLSTTLATNAIVEGTGQAVGALLLGFDKYDLARISHKPVRSIRGRVDIQGDQLEPLDEEGLRKAVAELEQDKLVQAYAVSGMSSVKNPVHEKRAREIVQSMTSKPVICGHETSMLLDSIKRTNTAVLNARLLPVIAELMDRIKAMMTEYRIHAPLMVVRADGTLLSEAAARRLPVETILSGPAASIWGARFLTGIDNGLVVDIGGTTSDMALIIDGQPSISASGATIADWSTHVRAVDIDTIGLAGDSSVSISRDRHLSLGPRRAEPLSVLAHSEPQVLVELQRLLDLGDGRSSMIQPVEFFRILKGDGSHELNSTEARTLEALSGGPLSRDRLGEVTGVLDPSMVPTARMESLGVIQRATLTPTDILHVQGTFTRWNTEAARLGLHLFAVAMELPDEALAELVMETFIRQATEHLVGRILRQKAALVQDGTAIRYGGALAFHPGVGRAGIHRAGSHRSGAGTLDEGLLQLLLSNQDHLGFALTPSYQHPLIAIGAPASALAPGLAKRMGAALVIPEHADVANAVGAIVSMEYLVVEAVVSPKDEGFVVHGPKSRKTFADLEPAREWAGKHAMKLLEERIAEEGQSGLHYQKELQFKDSVAETSWGPIFVECTVRAVGVCKPALG
ncbi:MAG: hydantoinase/oxoprolinase family protein [Spirochaetia bacterium]|jgi:N-methylhydantoinase A/oxoprolinase/acetone carboxylase beta subunit|nr:hydantoinase/oxoprolinase family protein [Spirochaetia bacterium]